MELARKLLRVADGETRGARGELAGVADLTATLGVERRAREDHHRFVAGGNLVDRAAVLQQRDDLEFVGGLLVVTEELRRRELRGQFGRHRRGIAELAGGT